MNRLTQISLLVLGGLLLLSVLINVFQYHNRRPPVVETVTVRDTLSRVDTVVRVITNRVVVDKPVPVSVDTTNNIRTYKDTIHHPFGTIRRQELVFGELLKKEIDFDLHIPEITRTITVNQVTTNTVRNRLLYGTVGLISDPEGKTFPSFGAIYVLKDHKIVFGADYGLNKSISARVGFSLIK